MTTLIRIAATQGKLNHDAPMVSFFPNRTISNRDARKERITVRHLASNSSGLDCTERHVVVGLDEIFRSSRDGRSILARGQWADAATFVLECNEGPGLNAYELPLHFQANRVSLDIPGPGSLEGRVVD